MEQQVKMSIGALKQLSTVWEMAGAILMQVRMVARTVLNAPRDHEDDTYLAQRSLPATENDDMALTGFETLIEGNDDSWFDELFDREAII